MNVGDVIYVECQVQPGPFLEERVVTIETLQGPISGFVREIELKEGGKDEWMVRAKVRAIRGDELEVLIRGSFFTTNGVASVPKRLAMAA